MFDQLRAVNTSDDELALGIRRACSFMDRAVKLAFQDRPINFAQLLSRRGVVHAHNNAVWVKEISNRRPLAQKFRIRSNPKLKFAILRVSRQRATELQARSRRHCALFNYEL